MAFCGNCGNALGEGQRFCPSCGQPVGGAPPAAAGMPPSAPQAPAYGQQSPPMAPPQGGYAPPPGYQQAPVYGQAYPQQNWGAQPAKGSRKGVWIGLASAVVVIAVACVLVFVVFKGDIFGGASSSPEGTVRAMLTAIENRDVDAVYDLLDPDALDQITGFMDEESFKESLSEGLLDTESIKFSDIEMSTDEIDDTTAVVTIVSGSVTMTQDGDTETEDVADAGEPVTFDLVKRDGSWYLDPYGMNML